MKISEVLSQQKLQVILVNIILRVEESENIRVKDLIEEIKWYVSSEKMNV
jgi:predicted DNA-binding protein (UPF0251 family)